MRSIIDGEPASVFRILTAESGSRPVFAASSYGSWYLVRYGARRMSSIQSNATTLPAISTNFAVIAAEVQNEYCRGT
jgi:hypothetical protein